MASCIRTASAGSPCCACWRSGVGPRRRRRARKHKRRPPCPSAPNCCAAAAARRCTSCEDASRPWWPQRHRPWPRALQPDKGAQPRQHHSTRRVPWLNSAENRAGCLRQCVHPDAGHRNRSAQSVTRVQRALQIAIAAAGTQNIFAADAARSPSPGSSNKNGSDRGKRDLSLLVRPHCAGTPRVETRAAYLLARGSLFRTMPLADRRDYEATIDMAAANQDYP